MPVRHKVKPAPLPGPLGRRRILLTVLFLLAIRQVHVIVNHVTEEKFVASYQDLQNDSDAPTISSFVDKSPWVSYPKMSNVSMFLRCEAWNRTTTRYAPRLFVGGAKAGSTALWKMLLTGTPWSGTGTNSSDYLGFAQEWPDQPHGRWTGKEMCFGDKFRYPVTVEFWESLFEPSSNISNTGLDCCPQGTEQSRVCNVWHLFPCEAKFIMPVRDTAERALSWYNDKQSSGKKRTNYIDVDTWVRNSIGNRNYLLDTILMEALECIDPKAILIVDSDGFKASPEEAQGIMDAIDEHYGLPRMRHVVEITNQAAGTAEDGEEKVDSRHSNAKLANETIQYIRSTMKPRIERFVHLLEQPGKILQKSLA